ncbi:PREDICTED: uncharacterized protein LOC109188097 [Ipomoea nil]|uniref:uncharacterized protein LOC109188097 n=1 Tax=Ipomoea nil TaxID=35883 RepID=UPI0009009164|nr:PREDICTED: uncharacterized protein LOC109188097 [Ipomoea nil]
MRFERKGKLSPRFIGPYEILERVGSLAYRLALPMELESVHNVFHVSQLKRYVHDPAHVLPPEVIPIDEDLSYEERPLRILDFKTRETRRKSVKMVKVWWTHHGIEEATWELESTMRERYPELFVKGTLFSSFVVCFACLSLRDACGLVSLVSESGCFVLVV